MIIDIPSSDEFIQEGISSLNLAWEQTISLISEYYEIEDIYSDNIEGIEDVYWPAARKSLTTAMILTQQGAEFILKGKIAAVSPFLLLTDWPKSCTGKDISFSDFKTIDAQDLIRVHNTVATAKLPESFKIQFDRMRYQRNAIMHTVSKALLLTAKEVIIAILETTASLLSFNLWISLRDEYLKTTPSYVIDSLLPKSESQGDAFRVSALAREVFEVVDFLEPALVKKYFRIDKKKRRYACPKCVSIMEQQYYFEFGADGYVVLTATLAKSDSHGEEVFCILCDTTYPVIRQKCFGEEEHSTPRKI